MTTSAVVVSAILLAAGAAGCGPDAESRGEPLGEAEQAQCGGYVVANVVTQEGTVYAISPQHMLDCAEAWGPQTLLLAVDRSVEPQVTIVRSGSAQVEKKKLTRSLQDTLGYSLTKGLELTASSSTAVPEGTYRRLEAYPTFQRITWELWQSACGPWGGMLLATGTVLRPFGVYFRIVDVVRGRTREDDRRAQPPASTGSPAVTGEAAGIF